MLLSRWRCAAAALPARRLPFGHVLSSSSGSPGGHRPPGWPAPDEVLGATQQLLADLRSRGTVYGRAVAGPLLAATKGKLRPSDLTEEQWGQLGGHLEELRDIIARALGRFGSTDVTRSVLALHNLSSAAQMPDHLRELLLGTVQLLLSRLHTPGAVRKLSGFEAATLLHVLARGQIQEDKLVPALCEHIVLRQLVSDLPGSKVADLAWALAKHRVRNPDLLAMLAERLAEQDALDAVLPHRLCFVVWAFAVLGHPDVRLASAIASHLLEDDNLSHCDNAGLSLLAWGLGRLELPEPQLMAAIAARMTAPGGVPSFSQQSFCNAMWGFAKLGLTPEPLRMAFMEYLRQPNAIPDMQYQGVANVIWALGKLGVYDPPVLEALAANLLQEGALPPLTPSETQFVLWGCAMLGFHHPALVAGLAQHMRHTFDFPTLSATDVGTLCSLLATLDVQDDELLAQLLQLVPRGPALDWPEPAMAGVHLLALHIQLEPKKFRQSMLWVKALSPELARCRAAFEAENAEAPPTELHRTVVGLLQTLSDEVEGRTLLPAAGALPVDAVFAARRRAFLVLGPSCYIRDGVGWHPTGATLLRQRLLRGFFYRPCCVPFYDWDALPGEDARYAYLEKLLL